MRSAVAYTEYLLSQPSQKHTETRRARNRNRNHERSRWWFLLDRLAAVMVVGAVFQFIRRLIVLVIGIVKLSYRKVCTAYTHIHYCKVISPL